MKSIALLTFLSAVMAFGQNFNVSINGCDPFNDGGPESATERSICTQLENGINDDLTADTLGEDISIDQYADGVGNSLAIASQGHGADHVNDFSLIYVAANVGVGLDGGNNSALDSLKDDNKPAGFGLAGNLTIGLNTSLLPMKKLWFIDLSKLALFANFFTFDADEKKDDITIKGDIASFGIHARYRLYDPISFVPGGVVKWTGVTLAAGFNRSSMEITGQVKAKPFTTTVNESGTNYNIRVTNPVADLTIDSTITTIDFEVGTGIQLIYALTLYGGLGANIVTGDSDVKMVANADVAATGGTGPMSGTVDANQNVEGDPESLLLRGFAGLQINLPYVKTYLQLNKALTDETLAAQFGVKITI